MTRQRKGGDPAGQRFQATLQARSKTKPTKFESSVAAVPAIPKDEIVEAEDKRSKEGWRQAKKE
jgi:hypothetical protein